MEPTIHPTNHAPPSPIAGWKTIVGCESCDKSPVPRKVWQPLLKRDGTQQGEKQACHAYAIMLQILAYFSASPGMNFQKAANKRMDAIVGSEGRMDTVARGTGGPGTGSAQRVIADAAADTATTA